VGSVSKQPRTKKKRRPRAPTAGDHDTPRRTARLTLEALEIARGHDGLLRGKPEPALLVALYRTNGPLPASLVGRLLLRAPLNGELPCKVQFVGRELRYDARFAVAERILVVALAIEEDSGRGVEALYAALETPEQFLLYAASEAVPSPLGLDEWSRGECRAPAACAVEILLGGENCENVADSDKLIAAAAFSVPSQAQADDAWRVPFVSRDRRNDWTLLVRMRVAV